ncbi:MDR family MFS transporter [Furfurilactobacillus siliginis]|uniref:MFS transporter n=1 Tax=Furfurilactobacillus siliginis TaxID=348151 RepID=A0A0R2LB09_9LACO|nr:MDR family MFS transporter [Furfurilactobacillus siliginis]KRN96476.1 multidrug transport protein [Furfurilactobacillus siliginis]GEK29427.1 MFS transporter [Furfurilactobacillus siliginis]
MSESSTSFKVVDANGKPFNRLALVITMLIGTFSTFIVQTTLTTAFPTLMRTFNIDADAVQWLTTGFMLVMGITIPISAFLLQRFSSKSLYLMAMVIFFIGTFICMIAPTFGILLTGRLIEAVAVGITAPTFQTTMLTIFPPEKRGSAMGLAGIVIGLAPAIGPTLSGWLLLNYSWRSLFVVILPFPVIVFCLALFTMRKIFPTKPANADWLSVALSTIGFGSMLYAFSSVGASSWTAPKVYITLIVGAIFVSLFVWRSLTIKNPLLELRVFSSPVYTLSVIEVAVVNMAMMGAEMVVPLYIQTVRGESAFHSGLILLPGALMMGLMSPITGRIFDRIGARRLAITGMLLLTVGTAFFTTLTESTPIIFVTLLYTIRMFGIAMVMMPVTTTGMNALPLSLMSHGTSVNNTGRQVFSSMGTAVLISVLTNVTKNNMPAKNMLKATPLAYRDHALNATLAGYHAAFWTATIFAFVGLVLTFWLKPGNIRRHN